MRRSFRAAKARAACRRKAGVGQRFQRLARKWRKETAHLSSASQMARHPAYREIIRMGWSAVPLIIAELRRKPDHWFIALEEITGENPIPEDSEGHVKKMAQAWIRWADEGGRPPPPAAGYNGGRGGG